MAKSGEGKRPPKGNIKTVAVSQSEEDIERKIRSLTGQIGIMSNSIQNTAAHVETLNVQHSTLHSTILREQAEKDACLEKMCRENEEDEGQFREKTRSIEVRLDKSRKILDELVERRFQSRNIRLQQIKELEDAIVETRLNIDKIKLESTHTLERIGKLIKVKLTNYLSE